MPVDIHEWQAALAALDLDARRRVFEYVKALRTQARTSRERCPGVAAVAVDVKLCARPGPCVHGE